MTRRCPQCNRDLPLRRFIAKNDTRYVRVCLGCRRRYGNWGRLSIAERRARMKPRQRTGTGYTTWLVLRSHNRKTGPIPVSMTDMASCPSACSFRNAGCYAEFGPLHHHWRNVGLVGDSWGEFCEAIAELPVGTFWRHNEAGDLPGMGDELDIDALAMLVRANAGRRGFTFTHKPLRSVRERAAIAVANVQGFTINLSADSLERADERADLCIGPVSVVLPSDAGTRSMRTPAGRTVVVCPADTAGVTCMQCQLCANATRKSIVGFRAHGQGRAVVSSLVQLRRKEERLSA